MTDILIGSGNDEMSGRNALHREEPDASYKWIPPVTSKSSVKSSFWEILVKYLKLYCENTCLVGVKYTVYKKATIFGRLMWICGYMFISYLTASFVYEVYTEYINGSTSTTLTDESVNSEIQFPGVAICTVNRISKRAGMELTRKMFEANITTMTMDQIYNTILTMGDLYNSAFMPNRDYFPIDELLSKFYNDDYEITDILEMLTPQCSDMFVECYFGGKKRNCLETFRLSKTSNGFCCTFNYIVPEEDRAKADNAMDPPEIFLAESPGLVNGLTVSIHPLLDDYAYPTLPTTGWKVMVFNPRDYPDSSSGSVFELLVAPLMREYIQLLLFGLLTNKVIQSYPVEKRGCIFVNEDQSYHKLYTFNQCIVSCRVEDIWKNCKCRPFFYRRYGHTKHSRRTCGVRDIICLQQYYATKVDIIPHHDETLMNMIPDKEKALVCNNCYPECDDTTYFANSLKASLEFDDYDRQLFPDMNTTNQSIIHVYFTEMESGLLKQDENYRWYEHLSDAGGICSFFIGFSIITIVELFYFFALFLLEVCSIYHVTTKKKNPNKKIMVQPTYFNEYFPSPRIDETKYKGNNDRF
ncbi:sodium channel protein Nach-like [Osmia bicornis bicornis]|uniref:sodium channel protein Nach-like n=1 Tax=Osmia bicornis bicornis TaxID=1437191 RepID=UPI001EAE8AA0|nr:sodium channel protein Nach-like [Osmia bicornis bicornis]